MKIIKTGEMVYTYTDVNRSHRKDLNCRCRKIIQCHDCIHTLHIHQAMQLLPFDGENRGIADRGHDLNCVRSFCTLKKPFEKVSSHATDLF
jgi:hypothetical protein